MVEEIGMQNNDKRQQDNRANKSLRKRKCGVSPPAVGERIEVIIDKRDDHQQTGENKQIKTSVLVSKPRQCKTQSQRDESTAANPVTRRKINQGITLQY